MASRSKHKDNFYGKIKSVYCKNFVTYTECRFEPGEYLNLIIGPNGTGKSTIVAAILLALGGEPKLLSRSNDIKDYIKNGQQQAIVKVEIWKCRKSSLFTTYTRKFNEQNKSNYYINDIELSKKNFLDEITNFNIQISNLCTFLPQDRVQDFAKMNPQELFLNTINSVTHENVCEQFQRLKELQKEKNSQKTNITNDAKTYKDSTVRCNELKEIIERNATRHEYLKKVQICRAKKVWLEYWECEKKSKEYIKDIEKSKDVLAKHENNYNKLAKDEQIMSNKKKILSTDVTKHKTQLTKMLNILNACNEKLNTVNDEMQDVLQNAEREKRSYIMKNDAIKDDRAMCGAIEQDIINLKETIAEQAGVDINALEQSKRDREKLLNNVKIEIASIIKKHTEINNVLENKYSSEIYTLKRRIEQLKFSKEHKVAYLRENHHHVYKAYEWLKHNRQLFRGKVYDPIFLEINLPNLDHAKYIENMVNMRDLLAFTCEDKLDLSLFMDELCEKQNLNVNVGYAEVTKTLPKSRIPIDALKQYGFTCFTIDMLEGPLPVLKYLCNLYNLHTIPVGTSLVNRHTDNIPTDIRLYFSDTKRFSVNISEYTRQASVMQTNIRNKNILSTVGQKEFDDIVKRYNKLIQQTDTLKNERTTLEAKINELENQRTDLNKQISALNTKFMELEKLQKKLEKYQRKIADIEQQIKTPEHIDKVVSNIMVKKSNVAYNLIIEKCKSIKNGMEANHATIVANSRLKVYDEETHELRQAVTKALTDQKQAKYVVENIQKLLNVAEIKIERLRLEALELTDNKQPKHKNFPYKQEFSELPETFDELDDLITDYTMRANFMEESDQEIVNEYNNLCIEIERLQTALKDNEKSLQTNDEETKRIYDIWYEEIIKIVNELNKNFSKFMQLMGYVGEIALTNQSAYDFDTYGIQILVQYRQNVPLKALDRHTQSGGERAVAIANYTMSLQHITKVPFRCVDEINQGMDSTNERKIFDMLVDATTQIGGSQYFFVTPKLLPDLKYNERMQVHIIFNGPFISKDAFS